MADQADDNNDIFESGSSSDEDLETSIAIVDFIDQQCRQMAQACLTIADILDEDDDRMGDQQDGDHSVDPLRGVYTFLRNLLSGHESRFYRVAGFTIAEYE